jgi:hypothetical protein
VAPTVEPAGNLLRAIIAPAVSWDMIMGKGTFIKPDARLKSVVSGTGILKPVPTARIIPIAKSYMNSMEKPVINTVNTGSR